MIGRLLLDVTIILLVALLLGQCLGCATNPPDEPLCIEIDVDRGHCTHIVSGKTFEVSDTKPMEEKLTGRRLTWWEMRPVMIQMPPNTWAGIKKFIIATCKKTGQCKDTDIASWNTTAKKIDDELKRKAKK